MLKSVQKKYGSSPCEWFITVHTLIINKELHFRTLVWVIQRRCEKTKIVTNTRWEFLFRNKQLRLPETHWTVQRSFWTSRFHPVSFQTDLGVSSFRFPDVLPSAKKNADSVFYLTEERCQNLRRTLGDSWGVFVHAGPKILRQHNGEHEEIVSRGGNVQHLAPPAGLCQRRRVNGLTNETIKHPVMWAFTILLLNNTHGWKNLIPPIKEGPVSASRLAPESEGGAGDASSSGWRTTPGKRGHQTQIPQRSLCKQQQQQTVSTQAVCLWFAELLETVRKQQIQWTAQKRYRFSHFVCFFLW